MTPRIPYSACPLCDCSTISHLRDGDCRTHDVYNPVLPSIIRWMTCDGCGHVFTYGYWSDAALKVLFKKTHDHQKPGHDLEQLRYVWAPVVDKVAALISGGKWLDVGFGNGALLFTAAEYGYTPVGIDLRQSTVDAMKRIGIEAYCCGLADFPLSKPADVVSMTDVLEHMPFPGTALRNARGILAKNGILLISTPNMGCAVWQKYDAENRNPYWNEIEHYHNFTRDRMYSLLRETGFKPVSYGVSARYMIGMEIVARAI